MKNRHKPHPDFICIGMQKAATNWLYDQLLANSGAWMPPLKELHFFDRGFNFRAARNKFNAQLKAMTRGEVIDPREIEFFRLALVAPGAKAREAAQEALLRRRSAALKAGRIETPPLGESELAWYGALFTVAPAGAVAGDVTPGYSTLPDERIRALRTAFPDCRIVLGLRRPVQRTWSQLCQGVRRGGISEAEATSAEYVRRALLERPVIAARSHPMRIYESWASVFGEDAMTVYFFENVVRDPATVRMEVATALGLPGGSGDFTIPADENSKSDNRRIAMPDAVRNLLEEHFADEISRVKARFPEARSSW